MRLFKQEDGAFERVATIAEVVSKFGLLAAAIFAVWQIYLFQETTQIVGTDIDVKTLEVDNASFSEITLSVKNLGKVRVNLTAGMLKIRSKDPKKLTLRLKDSDTYSGEITIPNVFIVDESKTQYPTSTASATPDEKYLQKGTLFFDPGETIKMRFLVETQGLGICDVAARFDGNEPGAVWFEEQHLVFGRPPQNTGAKKSKTK